MLSSHDTYNPHMQLYQMVGCFISLFPLSSNVAANEENYKQAKILNYRTFINFIEIV